jgi:hypothetical protein
MSTAPKRAALTQALTFDIRDAPLLKICGPR